MIAATSKPGIMLFDLLKKLLYATGVLGLYHRVRNARTLTVIMFHRVLDPADARWAHCDPDYTVSADLFARCLRFFREHYNVVSAEQVLRARKGLVPLPRRALLVTFDDGWADNVQYALPRLQEHGMAGLMFVVSDAVDRAEPFYQEQIVSAWRRGVLSIEALAEAVQSCTGEAVPRPAKANLAAVRSLIARIEALPPVLRGKLLDALRRPLDDGLRHMVTTEELHVLDKAGVSIGLHGKSHVPMTQATDLSAELEGARAEMAARLLHGAAPTTLSFPHGRYTPLIAQHARESGYELVFTSVPVVNPAATVGWLLGRLGFEADAVTDRDGRFRPDKLALYLFRRPSRLLA